MYDGTENTFNHIPPMSCPSMPISPPAWGGLMPKCTSPIRFSSCNGKQKRKWAEGGGGVLRGGDCAESRHGRGVHFFVRDEKLWIPYPEELDRLIQA